MTEREIENMLRSHGLSITATRKAVALAVLSFPHSDAEQILEQARKKSGTISKQAVYNNLHALTKMGVFRSIQPKGHPTRFEYDNKDGHHHIVCRSCELTVDVHCKKKMKQWLSPDKAMGFALQETEVTFWGLCPSCQAYNRPKRRKDNGFKKSK